MEQLLVCDFDGTLYRKGEERQFKQILDTIQKKKIPLAVASGRPWHMLRPYFEEVLDSVFLISNDGALITLGEQILYSRPIDSEQLSAFCNEQSGDWVCYGQLLSYLNISGLADRIRWRQTFRQHTVTTRSVSEIEEPVYKIFFMNKTECPEFLTPTYDQFGIMEFAAKGVNKAEAVKWLLQQSNLSAEQCIVFGDGTNDTCLFELTDQSYAMVHAKPMVKQSANHICTDLYQEITTIFKEVKQYES